MFKNYCPLCISDKNLCAYCKIISGPPTHFRKRWKESDLTFEKLMEIKKKGEENIKIREKGYKLPESNREAIQKKSGDL